MRGIIDQLQLDSCGRVQVVEHKTRARPNLPRPEQVLPLPVLQDRCQCVYASLRYLLHGRVKIICLFHPANQCEAGAARSPVLRNGRIHDLSTLQQAA